MEFEPGTRVENLEIERELGRGAFGVVYLARDVLLGRAVALKVIPGGGADVPEEVREAVLKEARIVAGLKSPHIVTLFRLHEAPDGGYWQEMEFVGGGSLEDRLPEGEPLPLEEAVRVIRGVFLGLRTAHAARVLHGDLKPGNVLFGTDDDEVKLADFGVSRLLEGAGTEIPLEGQVFGTPLYMAPEVLTGRAAGFCSDLWSAGVLAYLLLSGRLPFHSKALPELMTRILLEPPAPLPEEVPSALGELVLSCLAKETDYRPASAGKALEMLDRAIPSGGRGEPATNVEPAAAPLVGREEDLAAVSSWLTDERIRLVTVTGPPGVGKSRFARELSLRLAGRFPGGAWRVDLEAARDLEDLERMVAGALGGGELRYRKRTLLWLDGPEGVIAALADQLGRWGREAVPVVALVASRAILSIAGEQVHELGPLSEEHALSLWPEAGAAALAAVRAAEGMPLGILAGRAALVGAVARSHDLLADWERETLSRAAALPDGLTLDEAEDTIDLSGFEDAPLTMDALQSLAEKSLIRVVEDRFAVPGFVAEYLRSREG